MIRKTVKAVLFLYVLCLLLATSLSAGELTRIYVNGMKLGVYPLVKEGIAYLPANAMAQSLGIKVFWNADRRILKINDKVIAASPLVYDGKLYLPVETIAQGSGATVEWDGTTNSIRISNGGNPPAVASLNNVPDSPTEPKVAEKTTVKATPVPKETYTPVPVITAPKPSLTSENRPQDRNPSKTVSGPTVVHKPPTAYSGQPTKSAYPDRPESNVSLRPTDAPPVMPSNLSLPPMSTTGEVSTAKMTFSSTSPFIPRSEKNNTFRVTITNVEYVDSIKDYYKPKPGYRFVIVYLSQQNISEEVQIYTGRFSLLDQNNHSYDYIEGLSNFWLVILRPGGINFGYLVFELPADSKPMSTILHALNQAPLTVNLR